MSDLISDGNVRVSWATTIANIAAPTTTELNAGTRLDTIMTPDGLKIDPKTGTVDTSSLSSTFNTNKAGRRAYDIELGFKHQSGTDTAFLLFPYQTNGYLVVRRGTAAGTAWASSDKVEVYPAECGEAMQVPPAENTVLRFNVPLYMTADPNTRATVA